MDLRRRSLPVGWYSEDPESLERLLASWLPAVAQGAVAEGRSSAVVAPHAGWAFSGRIAASALAALAPAPTIAVVGGHLGPHEPPLAAPEEAFETPLGNLGADIELRDELASELERRGLSLRADDEADNTVEVQLPLVARLFPRSRVLWLRAPNGPAALELGKALRAAASSIGREVSCVGSTDLTHYGPNYGFSPAGRGPEAEAWVRDVNDRRFIDALLALDPALAIELGERERSACSSGAAAAALEFARASGAVEARLIEYATSLDLRRDASFVGYAAIAFR